MQSLNLTPAYGRDYKNVSQVVEAFNRGNDFILNRIGQSTYINRTDIDTNFNGPVFVQIRYGSLRKVHAFKYTPNK